MLAFNEISDKLETVLKRLEAVEGYGSLTNVLNRLRE